MSRVVSALACGAFALGAFLRFHHLEGQSLWFDEMLQARITKKPFLWILGHMPADKPPLDYWLQHLAILAGGETDFALRFLPAVWGCLTLAAVFLWARSALGPEVALVALTLLALSPLHIHFSQEGRPYALFLLLTTCVSWVLWELLDLSIHSERPGRITLKWFTLALLTFAAAWTLYLSLVHLILLQIWLWSLWAATRRRSPETSPCIRSFATRILILDLAAALSLLTLLPRIRGAVSASHAFEFERLTWSSLLTHLNAFAFGQSSHQQPPNGFLWAAPLFLVGAVWGIRRAPQAMSLLLTLSVGTFGGMLTVYAAIGHWFEVRYALAALPSFLIIAAMGLVGLVEIIARVDSPRARPALIAALLALATAAGFALAVPYLLKTPYFKTDWRRLATYLQHAAAGRRVLLSHPWHQTQIDYYLERFAATTDTEVHTDFPALVQRAEDLHDSYVMLTWDTEPGPLHHWLWGYPMPMINARGLWLWHVHDPAESFANEPGVLEHATDTFMLTGQRIELGNEPYPALGLGWGEAERFNDEFPFRWTAAKRAQLLLPLTSPEATRVVFRAMPHHYPGAPAQETIVRINGNEAGRGVIIPGWATYAVNAPASVWKPGLNILEFETAYCIAPGAVSGSRDIRSLGIAVAWIDLDDNQSVVVDHTW